MTTWTRKVPTAREWSEKVAPRDFRPRDLDLYVLQQYDHVLKSLGWRGRYRAGSSGDGPRNVRRDDLIFIPLFVLPMAGMFATGGGGWFTTAGGGVMEFEGFDSRVGLPIVVACYVLSIPGPLLVLRRWWTSNRRWTAPELGCLAFVVVCSLLSLRGISAWDVDVLRAAPASLPIWATLILATTALIAIAPASRGRRDAVLAHFERAGEPDDPARSRELVEALSPGERENLITQRRSAIATLRDRGLIDLDEAVHVESLPLGQSVAITT